MLRDSAAPDSDPEWLEAVLAALERQLVIGPSRSLLLVTRGTGRWFHVMRSANRESIRCFGLDSSQIGSVPGIAAASSASGAACFFAGRCGGAYWFAGMASHDPTDI